MKDKLKVSVITITKNLYKDNRIEFFKQNLESVHNQTYPNIEHIIIDGASTDGTLEFLKPYEEKGWVKVYSEEDNGCDDAYNKGTEKATGKYIAWMNSDDWYYSNDAIEASINALEKENADYSYGKQVTYNREGKKVGEFIPRMEQFYRDMPFSHQTLFLKKDVLLKLGGYNIISCYGAGDYFLVLQLILNDYKGVYVDKYISHYTTGGFSCSWDNKFRIYTITSLLAKRSLSFYRQFYPEMDEDEAQLIYWKGSEYESYPKLFLEKMIRFMVEKQLKNFNYDRFINHVNSIINGYYEKTFYFLYFIKILSLEWKGEDKLNIKLFGFIPLLKIRRRRK